MRTTIRTFIERATKVYGDKYDYSKVVYKGVDTKVIIGCKIHGEFLMRPRAHYADRRGCPKCDKSGKSGFAKSNEWSKKLKWFYVIESIDNGVEFLIYGETVEYSVKERMIKGYFKTKFNTIFLKRLSGEDSAELKENISKEFSTNKYIPTTKFKGRENCLDINAKLDLENFIKDFQLNKKKNDS